jgi:hypothetical protein
MATLRSTCHTLSNVYIRFPVLAHFREKKIVAMTYESTLVVDDTRSSGKNISAYSPYI